MSGSKTSPDYAKTTLLLVIAIILAGPGEFSCVFGQSKPQFKHVTRDQGLSSNRILCITQDKFGFMWFGTEYGLTRYDGSDFEIFINVPEDTFSLRDNTINCIAEEPGSGNLWVGTPSGLNYYNRKENKFYRDRHYFPQKSDTRNSYINDIIIDHNGNLWVAKFEGIFFFTPAQHAPVNYYDLHARVDCLYEDSNHSILAGARNKLYRFDLAANAFNPVALPVMAGKIAAIDEDSRKNLWISSRDYGIFRMSPDHSVKQFSTKNHYLQNNRVQGITEDEKGNIWIAVRDGGGIHYLDTATDAVTLFSADLTDSKSLSSNVVSAIYKDRTGNIWVGTWANGVSYYDRHAKRFDHHRASIKPDELMSNNVRCVYQDSEGDVWIGTVDRGGLSKFNPVDGSFTNYKSDPGKPYSLNDDYVLSITEAEPGKLVIGTYRKGISVFDKKSEKFFPVRNNSTNYFRSSSIYQLSKDRYDSIWVSTSSDVYIFDSKTLQFKARWKIKTPKNVLDYSDDEMYVGTDGYGLYRINRKTNTVIKYNQDSADPAGLPDNNIHSMAKDSQGLLWMATNKGITAFDPRNNVFTVFGVKDGLPSDMTCGILIDDHDNVWVSTANGLAKFNQRTKKITVFDVHDGLQGKEFEKFVCGKMKTGEMIFGGRNGFNYFHPDQIDENPVIPNVVITDLSIFNEPVLPGTENSPLTAHISLTDALTLNHEQNAFSLGFVGINFTAPEKNQYAYMLEGFDRSWNYTRASKRYATYTNLPSGNYEFKIKASNNDGLWNEKPATIQVNILPPPWKTWWAYLLYILASGTVVYLSIRYIHMRKDFKLQLQLARMEKEKADELNKMKINFFTNISHEFKTPLTLIIGALHSLTKNGYQSDHLKNQLGYIQRNATRLQNLISQLIDFRRIESKKLEPRYQQGDIVDFLRKLLDVFQPVAGDRNIELLFNTLEENIITFFDADKTEKIFYNLLSNAIKFTPEKGNITVLAAMYSENNTDFVRVSVANTGTPIAEKELAHLFEAFYHSERPNSLRQQGTGIGLAFAKDLVNALGGKINIESNAAATSFTVLLPYIKNVSALSTPLPENGKFEYSHELVKTLRLADERADKPINAKAPSLLIVEDDKELSEFLFGLFAEDYRVITATNGRHGLDLALTTNPELILSDILMPELSGIELCHKIKSDIATSHIPVILLTASADSLKMQGMETGADVYIEKPFNVEFLKLQVHNTIQTRKAIRQAFAKKISPEPENLTVTSTDEKFIKRAIAIVEENIDNPDFHVDAFVKEIGISRTVLYDKIKALTDLPANEFILNIRLKRAIQLLKDTDLTIAQIAFKVGFNSPKYFSSCFKKFFKESPSQAAEKYRASAKKC